MEFMKPPCSALTGWLPEFISFTRYVLPLICTGECFDLYFSGGTRRTQLWNRIYDGYTTGEYGLSRCFDARSNQLLTVLD